MRMMTIKTVRTLVLAFAIAGIIILSSSAAVKAVPFTMRGRVVDQDGNPIPGVTMTYVCNSTGLSVTNVTNPDGTFNGFGFGISDMSSSGGGDIEPLGYIYEDGGGDRITVTLQKEGYEDEATAFFLSGNTKWLNLTMEKTPLPYTLIGGAIGGLCLAIIIYFIVDKRAKERKEAARKQKKRRRK